MFRRPFVHRSLVVVLLLTAVASVEMFAPPLATPDVTACTLYQNKKATQSGCISSWGYNCYRCEYTTPTSSQTCYEYPNPDDGRFCDQAIDQRDIPGDLW